MLSRAPFDSDPEQVVHIDPDLDPGPRERDLAPGYFPGSPESPLGSSRCGLPAISEIT